MDYSNSFSPQNFIRLNFLLLSQLLAGNAVSTYETPRRSLNIRQQLRMTLQTLAYCCVQRGNMAAARDFVTKIENLPRPSYDIFDLLRQHNPRWASELGVLLRQAGVKDVKR